MSSSVQTNGTKRFAVLDVSGVSQISVSKTSAKSAVETVAPIPAAVKSVVPPSSEENLYKSVLSIEERVAVAMSVGEEVVTEEELTAMYKGYCMSTISLVCLLIFAMSEKSHSESRFLTYMYGIINAFMRLTSNPFFI
jgi:hypothetical protein